MGTQPPFGRRGRMGWAVVLVAVLLGVLGEAAPVVQDVTQLDASPDAAQAAQDGTRTQLPPVSFSRRALPQLLKPLPPPSAKHVHALLGDSKTAAMSHSLETHELEARDEPPVQCYKDLVAKIGNTETRWEHHKAQAKVNRAGVIEADKSMQAWKTKTAVEKGETTRYKVSLDQVHVEWKVKHDEAQKVYAQANDRLGTYHSERKMVTIDAARAKEAFTEYMKYKEQMLMASADDSTVKTDAESQEFSRMAQQSLSSYHASLHQMQSRRSVAEQVRQQYNQNSELYHNVSNTCDALGQVLANTTHLYRTAKGRRDNARAEFDAAEKAFVAHSLAYREELGRSQQEMEMLEIEKKARMDAKRRYWELSDMQQKYEDLGDKLTAEAGMLGRRFIAKSRESENMLGDIQRSEDEMTDLKQKESAAKAASDSFSEDYEKASCGPAGELAAMAGRIAAGHMEDSDGGTTEAATESTADTPEKVAEEVKLDDGVSAGAAEGAAAAAESPANKQQALYQGFYKDFLGRYKDKMKEADELQARSKKALGDSGYSDCQYYTKLVSMYTDLSYQNLRYKDWIEEQSDLTKAEDLKKALTVQQKATLNDARAAHFKQRMGETCKGAAHAARVQKEHSLRDTAETHRRSALSFLQLSAREVTRTADGHMARVKAEKDAAQDGKDTKSLEAYCATQRELTLASMGAVKSTVEAQQQHGAYLKMARSMQVEAASASEDAANRRHMVKRKIRDYAEYTQEAATSMQTPCSEDV